MAGLNLTLENRQTAIKIVGNIVWGWQKGAFRGRAGVEYLNDTVLKVHLDVLPPNRLANLIPFLPQECRNPEAWG